MLDLFMRCKSQIFQEAYAELVNELEKTSDKTEIVLCNDQQPKEDYSDKALTKNAAGP